MFAISRIGWWIAGVVLVLGGMAVLTLAMPVEMWRTGRAPVAALALSRGGPVTGSAERIWIDTDAACGAAARTDPDDCFAIALLFKSRGEHIVGLSTVFGNAALAVTDSTTRALMQQLTRGEKFVIEIRKGAAFAIDDARSLASTPAREALREALTEGPLTIISLGPLTNIAAALDQRPGLQTNVKTLIAVMGHRPGHIFHPTEGAGGATLLGHGPIFRDFNFAQDKEAAARIVSMHLPLTLIPYDAARNLMLTDSDLKALSRAGGASKWIAERAGGWLAFWKNDIGQSGFYPFDLTAAAYVLHPASFDCATAQARVTSDDSLWTSWFFRSQALLVGPIHSPGEDDQSTQVTYCPRAQPSLKHILIAKMVSRRG